MKIVFKSIVVFIIALCLSPLASKAESHNKNDYIITKNENTYILTGTERSRGVQASTLTELLCKMERINSIYFGGITVCENVELPNGEYSVSGSITLGMGNTLKIPTGCNVSFCDMICLNEGIGGIVIDGGSLSLVRSYVYGNECTAVSVLSPSSRFGVVSGGVYSESDTATVLNKNGEVVLLGGVVNNEMSAALENRGNLILGGAPTVVGGEIDIVTDSAISIRPDQPYRSLSHLNVQYLGSFSMGSITPLFRYCDKEVVKNITIFDISKNEYDLTYFDKYRDTEETEFAAVYLPFCVNFDYGNGEMREEVCLLGEALTSVPTPVLYGYDFLYWTYDGAPYDMTQGVSSDMTLYPRFDLMAPTLSIADVSFVYDSDAHVVALDSLSHPLDKDAGYYTFKWYKNDAIVSTGDSISLRDVSDSGSYLCEASFHYNGDSSRATARFFVTAEKQKVKFPNVPPIIYTGELLTPEVEPSPLYTVDRIYASACGEYPVKISLVDSENYEWLGGESASSTAVFKILKSPNSFIGKISVSDFCVGDDVPFSAKSKFGDVLFLYSSSENGKYTEKVPSFPGRYYTRAVVLETEAYYGIESLPIPFCLSESISVINTDDEGSGYRAVLTIIVSLTLVFAIAIFSLIIKKRKLIPNPPVAALPALDDEFFCEGELSLNLYLNEDDEIELSSYNKIKADTLISDSLAKSLLKKSRDVIITEGGRRASLNVGMLSKHFSDSDKVDINVLKKRGLVPPDCGYLCIKPGGSINKALSVYANEFDLSAIKMIALSGGECFKATTSKEK